MTVSQPEGGVADIIREHAVIIEEGGQCGRQVFHASQHGDVRTALEVDAQKLHNVRMAQTTQQQTLASESLQ